LTTRLRHGSYDISFDVEIDATAINTGDLLVVISSSEETNQLNAFAKRAGAFVATIVLLTAKPDSTIGSLTDVIF